MDSLFPFGIPFPSAFYLTLYVLTFALHHAMMHYVVAGCLFLTGMLLLRKQSTSEAPIPAIGNLIRDWMPFLLSAAITAGVAPLLFVQIVYPRHFYTANVLLSWRWMIVVPVLIVAFYLLYLIKSRLVLHWPRWAALLVVATASICFLFVGFCWTANHLLANSASRWTEIYASNVIPLPVITILLRTLVWTGGSFATLAIFLGWQLRMTKQDDGPELATNDFRRLTCLSASGLLVAVIAGSVYLIHLDPTTRGHLLGTLAFPYLVAALLGVIVQITAWWIMMSRAPGNAAWLTIASFAWGVTLVATSVLRECIRLSAVDVGQFFQHHADAAAIGGFALFVLFAVINGGLIAACVWIVRRKIAA